MTTANTISTQEAEIRQLVTAQQRAICTKDVEQIMSRYADEISQPHCPHSRVSFHAKVA